MDLQPKNFVPLDDLSQANKVKSDIVKENQYYQELLAKPLSQLIQETADAKSAYENQQKIMQMWILQQKAFQSLAFELGNNVGQDNKTTWNQAVEKMEKVLNKENPDNLNKNISEAEMEKLHNSHYYFYLKQTVEKLKVK